MRTLLYLRQHLHNPGSASAAGKSQGLVGLRGHRAHGKAGKGIEGTGGSAKQLTQGFSNWTLKVNIQILLLPIAVVSFPTWLGG